MSFEPEWVNPTACALSVDAARPVTFLREGFHFGLWTKDGHIALTFTRFGLRAKHDPRVAIDSPLEFSRKNEVLVVVLLGRQVGARRTWNRGSHDNIAFSFELAVPAEWLPVVQVFAIVKADEPLL